MRRFNFYYRRLKYFIFLSFSLFIGTALFAQSEISQDTLISKKAKKKADMELLKGSHRQARIRVDGIYANLETTLSFELLEGILTAKVGLEDEFGLPGHKYFFTGDFYYRFTPRSSLYAQYYGINRSHSATTQRDIIFDGDTIMAQTQITGYFNTQVLSTGYMYSIIPNPDAFLGVFINIYTMRLSTGLKTEINRINSNIGLTLPLPNFGLSGSFKLYPWLYFNATIGFFALSTKDLSGKLSNREISFVFKPIPRLGLNLSYKEFDIEVDFSSDNTNAKIVAEYNFRGPSFGATFEF